MWTSNVLPWLEEDAGRAWLSAGGPALEGIRRSGRALDAVVLGRRDASVGVESLEPSRDAGDELGVALAPVARVAHHFDQGLFRGLGRGHGAAAQKLGLAGAHHLMERQDTLVASSQRVVDCRVEMASRPALELPGGVAPCVGAPEMALQPLELVLCVDLAEGLLD